MAEMNQSSLDGERRQNVPRGLVPFAASHLPAVRADGRSHPGSAPDQPITARLLFDAIRYWWKVAVPAALLLAGIGVAAVYLSFRPMYEAAAYLRIEQRAPFIAFDIKSEGQSNAFVQTQVELIRSPIVLGPVIGDPQIAGIAELDCQEDKIRWLAAQLKVKPIGQSELFTISFACSEPAAAARVVNAVVKTYFKLRDEDESQRGQRVIDVLRQEQERKANEVSRLRENVREMAKQVTGKDPFASVTEQKPAQAGPLADLQNRLIAAEVEEQVLTARVKAFEEFAAKQKVVISEAMLERAIAENPRVQNAATQLMGARARLHQLESVAAKGKEDPSYRKAAAEIQRAEELLKDLQADVRKQAREQLEVGTHGKRDEELAAIRSDLENRRVARQLLRERYEKELGSARKDSGDSLNLRFKQDELARAERVLELISDRALKLQTEQGAPPRVSKLRDAEAPEAPLEKLPYKLMLIATLGGLCVPFGLAVLKEHIARRVSVPEDLERHAHLAVIGEISRIQPRQSTPHRHPRKGMERAIRLFEESVDSLRTQLLLASDLQTARVVAVTSAVNHEGKTSVAVQLAVSIARASRAPTLLIDGDLRSPRVHKVFDLPLEPGLTRVLGEECPLEDAVRMTWVEHLHVLPAGLLRGSPHRLLAHGAVKSLLEKVLVKYRYVIVDTPPVLAASESLVLAQTSDAFLMCVMRDVSRVYQVKKASERLGAAGAHLAGAVLSGVSVNQYVQRYGNYPYPPDPPE